MTKPFTTNAEFDLMTETKSCLDEVIHSTFVKVDEEGTETAAVTGITVRAMCLTVSPPPFDFIADRPFIFAIQKLGVGLLFVGCVKNPSE